MKRIVALALALTLAALVGCTGGGGAVSDKTPEELAKLYDTAITENGGEMVQYNPVFTEAKEDDGSAMILEAMGLNADDLTALGVSASMMNVKAYAIVAVMPAAGKADGVKEALQSYIDQQKASFETYLVDQYEIAKSAKLETLEDGTILMIMCEDQDTVFDGIAAAIQGK